MCSWDHTKRQILQEIMKFSDMRCGLVRNSAALLLTFQCLLVVACDAQPGANVELHDAHLPTPGCIADGQLSADLYGGIRATLAWKAENLECGGMIRPFGEGARLRFAGPLPGGDLGTEPPSLAFILGLPGLQQGKTASELPTNVTLSEVGTGRFYGTQDTENCWTDILSQDQIGSADSVEYGISGILYCVAPLAELNGSSSISFTDIRFTGRLSWETPK
jgi:hypothetical protein